MSDTSLNAAHAGVLRDHHLTHFVELRVSPKLLTSRFTRSCATASCSAQCCRGGALVDIAHRDRVLAEASLIVQYMEPEQEHDPARWFDEDDEPDADFPSGRAVNTGIANDTCVFLDSKRRCVLHLAEERSPGLKPFFCRAYPVAINHGCVTLDDDWCPDEIHCCAAVAGGERTALEFCESELEYMLGRAGVEELRRIAQET